MNSSHRLACDRPGSQARVIARFTFAIRAVVDKVSYVGVHGRPPAEHSTKGNHFISSDVSKVKVLKYSLAQCRRNKDSIIELYYTIALILQVFSLCQY